MGISCLFFASLTGRRAEPRTVTRPETHCFPGTLPPMSAAVIDRRVRLPTWARPGPFALIVLWYFLWSARLSVEIHQGYGTSAFDVGLYDQGLWLLSRFKAPFVTLMGRNLFGDHTSFTLLFLVPLYWIH